MDFRQTNIFDSFLSKLVTPKFKKIAFLIIFFLSFICGLVVFISSFQPTTSVEDKTTLKVPDYDLDLLKNPNLLQGKNSTSPTPTPQAKNQSQGPSQSSSSPIPKSSKSPSPKPTTTPNPTSSPTSSPTPSPTTTPTSNPTPTPTPAPDTSAPSSPSNVQSSVLSSSEINISWNASTDNTAVTGYDIYRNGDLIATVSPTTLNYNNQNLQPSTKYNYYIKAKDAAGNISAASSTTSSTTSPEPSPSN